MQQQIDVFQLRFNNISKPLILQAASNSICLSDVQYFRWPLFWCFHLLMFSQSFVMFF